MDVLILLGLILLNGLFAMSEIALVTARRARLQKLAEEGDGAAALAIRLGEDPTRFLSTIQIGITAIGILNGIVGEEAFAEPLGAWLATMFELRPRSGEAIATTLIVVVITYLTIVVGELVPKRIGQASAERIARMMARPIGILATLSRPFVALLTASTNILLRLLGRHALNESDLTEEDIHAVLREGSESGLIEKHEHDIVRKVFLLDDRLVTSLMTPRSEIVWLDAEQPVRDSLLRVLEANHSRLPVCKGSLDQLLGVITAKRLFRRCMEGEIVDLTADMQNAVFIPESLTGMQLLAQFRQSGTQMVFVVNEYGEVLGLVTLQDVLEALTGEFVEKNPEEQWALQRADGSWLLDGLIPVPELKEHLGLRRVPEEERRHYNTLAGMLMLLLDDVPRTGAITRWENWEFEVVDTDGTRLDKVLATHLAEAESADA